MPDAQTPKHARVLAVLLILAAMAGLVATLSLGQRLASEPQPIAWNKEPCAQCRMHIGDKGFAAQLQLKSGAVRSFDDPGCAFRALVGAKQADLHAVYFRHMSEDRWIPRDEVRFVPAEGTPMGYGLGAVDGPVEGSLSLVEAMNRVLGEEHAEARHGDDR